jgi:hypothetical protein
MRTTYWIAIALLAEGALTASSDGFGGHFDIGTGYRQDSIKIMGETRGISKHHVTPVVSSSFHLKNLSVYELLGQFETDHCSPLFLNISGAHGWITNGKEVGFVPAKSGKIFTRVLDLTAGTTRRRQSILSEATNANQVRGDTSDIAAKIGYRLFFADDYFSIAPLVGFGYQQLHTFIRHPSMASMLKDAFPATKITPAFTRIPQPVHFTAHSRGFLAGLEADWVANSCWRIYAGGSWNWHRTNTSTFVEEQFFRPKRRVKSSATPTRAFAEQTTINKAPATNLDLSFTSTDRFHPQGAEGHLGAFYAYNNWEIGVRGEYEYLYTRRGTGNIKFSAAGSGLEISETPITRTPTASIAALKAQAQAPSRVISRVIAFQREETVRRFHWNNWSAQLLVGYNF